MSVQKALFPGIIFGIFMMLGITSLLSNPNAAAALRSQQGGGNLALGLPGQNNAKQPEGCSISPSYPQSIQQWCGIIEKYAREHGLDPNLVSAVMLQESAGRADAYSKSGAVGLMQVMPRDGKASRFMCKNGPCFADRPTSEALYDPEFNVSYGAEMLSELIHLKNGNVRDALKSYGPMDVGYYYADIVLNIMKTHR
jgi:soluble lytic murein transglycosylase-like protein